MFHVSDYAILTGYAAYVSFFVNSLCPHASVNVFVIHDRRNSDVVTGAWVQSCTTISGSGMARGLLSRVRPGANRHS